MEYGASKIRKHYIYLSQLFNYALKHSDAYGIHINPMRNSTPQKNNKQSHIVTCSCLQIESYRCLTYTLESSPCISFIISKNSYPYFSYSLSWFVEIYILFTPAAFANISA